jgi:hypothetical protein
MQAEQIAVPDLVPIRALVDTGASCTCVDEEILKQLGLSATNYIPVLTPSTGTTPHQAPQYDAMLAIPGMPPLVFGALPITAADFRLQTIQALIGRDVLSRCLFQYNGSSGFFTIAY